MYNIRLESQNFVPLYTQADTPTSPLQTVSNIDIYLLLFLLLLLRYIFIFICMHEAYESIKFFKSPNKNGQLSTDHVKFLLKICADKLHTHRMWSYLYRAQSNSTDHEADLIQALIKLPLWAHSLLYNSLGLKITVHFRNVHSLKWGPAKRCCKMTDFASLN